jgi:hypothetical protein
LQAAPELVWRRKLVARGRHAEVQFGGIAAPPKLAVESIKIGGTASTEPGAMGDVSRHKDRSRAGLLAAISTIAASRPWESPETVIRAVWVENPSFSPTLREPPKRVDAAHRIGRFQIDRLDSHRRYQIPVHRVSDGVVEPGAIDVDGSPSGVPAKGEAVKHGPEYPAEGRCFRCS